MAEATVDLSALTARLEAAPFQNRSAIEFLSKLLAAPAGSVWNGSVSCGAPRGLNLHRGIAKQHVRLAHIDVGDM